MYVDEYIKKLDECAAVDVTNVDKNSLVDIKKVRVNTKLPEKERILDYISQVKNPYCYIDKGIIVKLSFNGTQSLEDCLVRYIASMQTQKSHN